MIWPGSNGQVAQGTDCDAQETPADEHADDSTWLCTPLHVCTQLAMAVLVPEPQELEQGVNGATLHEKVGQQGRAGQGCVWEVHAAPHIDAGTVEPLPGPETVVHVATFILEPACPQVPEQEPWRLYVHEYSEQIGTVQGDVWVWQPPGQFDAAVGVEGPPHRFWAMHEEVERRTPVHVVGGCVGDGVGGTMTHAGSVNLQCTPGVSTDCGLASKFISKVCRCRKTVSVSPAWPRVLRTTVRNALSCWSTLAFAAAPPSPQPPTASRKQSAKCRLIGLEKVGSSKVSPQQSQTARQSSKSVVVVGEPRSLKKPVQSETAETHLANSLAPAKIPYGPLGSPLHCQFEPKGSSQ